MVHRWIRVTYPICPANLNGAVGAQPPQVAPQSAKGIRGTTREAIALWTSGTMSLKMPQIAVAHGRSFRYPTTWAVPTSATHSPSAIEQHTGNGRRKTNDLPWVPSSGEYQPVHLRPRAIARRSGNSGSAYNEGAMGYAEVEESKPREE